MLSAVSSLACAPTIDPVSDAELNALLVASNLVTLARTGVEYDYPGQRDRLACPRDANQVTPSRLTHEVMLGVQRLSGYLAKMR
jgi:hypothetical protein